MSTAITVYDETTSGTRTRALTLDILTARISVRELIQKHVYEEVQEHNRSTAGYARGPVQPIEAEVVLNGYRMPRRQPIDWEEQYRHAVAVFARTAFFILVNDRQVTSLDEEIELAHDTRITFVKLVPLVGG